MPALMRHPSKLAVCFWRTGTRAIEYNGIVGVVCVSSSRGDELHGEFVNLVEVIRRVRDGVGNDLKHPKILEDSLLVLALCIDMSEQLRTISERRFAYLLLTRVSIVKPQNHPSLIHLRKILIQHRSLRMSNMQIPTRLRREPGDDVARHGIWKP